MWVWGYYQGYLATIKYKSEILRLKMGMYEITNDFCVNWYVWNEMRCRQKEKFLNFIMYRDPLVKFKNFPLCLQRVSFQTYQY